MLFVGDMDMDEGTVLIKFVPINSAPSHAGK